jgi:hypothetical protein
MTTYEDILNEIKLELSNGEELSDIRERSYELVDNYVPVYNNRILEEWQNMPSDYDNRGSAELGHNCEELNIINLMSADLYLYYSDLVSTVLDDLERELESVE